MSAHDLLQTLDFAFDVVVKQNSHTSLNTPEIEFLDPQGNTLDLEFVLVEGSKLVVTLQKKQKE